MSKYTSYVQNWVFKHCTRKTLRNNKNQEYAGLRQHLTRLVSGNTPKTRGARGISNRPEIHQLPRREELLREVRRHSNENTKFEAPLLRGSRQTWSPTNPRQQKASNLLENCAAKFSIWKHQLCNQISQVILRCRIKGKRQRFKVFKEIKNQHKTLWTVETKRSSIRFKVSVLLKVLRHWHHPWADLRSQHSVTNHKLEVTLSCFNKESIQCRKQHQHWLQLRVRHQRASRKLQWQYTILHFRRLLRLEAQIQQWHSLIVEQKQRSRGNYYWHVASTNRL